MIDSIGAYIELVSPLNTAVFSHERSVSDKRYGTVTRNWLAKDGYHVKYRHWQGRAGTLSIEFSLAAVSGVRYEHLAMSHIERGLDVVNEWLLDNIGPIADIRSWTCTRIDYALNFDVGSDLSTYLLMLGSLWLGSMQRAVYPEASGVLWKSKSRWVKFYDKAAQMGDGHRHDTLRFEVSNHGAAVQRMCSAWFGCERVVSELVHPARALYVLWYYWHKLGLDSSDVYETDVALHARLRDAFGSSSLSAYSALTLIHQHGAGAWRSDLMSRSAYYTWSRKLTVKGFLPQSSVSVAALVFPFPLFFDAMQDLKKIKKSSGYVREENLLEIFGLKNCPDGIVKEWELYSG